MQRLLPLLIALLLCFADATAALNKDNTLLLDTLVQMQGKLKTLVKAEQDRVDSIKALRSSLSPSLERVIIGRYIGDYYMEQNIDSAMTYWNLAKGEAEALELDEQNTLLTLRTLSGMPRNGITVEALEDFRKIDPRRLTADERREYWRRAAELYFNVQRPYPPGRFKEHYMDLAIEALDSLCTYHAAGSAVQRYIKAHINRLHGQDNLAAADFMELMPELAAKRPDLYNIALWNVANYYKDRPDYRQLYLKYMFQLCLNQMREGKPSAYIMAETGRLLTQEGKGQAGRNMMMQALSMSDAPSGPYQTFDSSKYAAQLKTETQKITFILVTIVVLLMAGIVVLLLVVRRKSERIRAMDRQLAISEESKRRLNEEMCSINANLISLSLLSTDQLQEYNLFISRKIKAHQIADLSKEVESGKYMQSLTDKYFSTFDESFLTAFPDFLDRVNALLQPDKQLKLQENGSLTPELRIAALIRMGVVDSNRLSKALGFSINTIYTYRNRLKGRALDRYNFDKNLQNLSLKH